ncbi:MAG: hypothetical protein Q9170_006792 [Blastenia crenularia]
MAETKLETTEPDPSSTAISNDTSVNTSTIMDNSNPTAEANSRVENDLPSTDDVDKAIAEVEARRKQREEANKAETSQESAPSKQIAVETDGHAAPENAKDVDGKKEPSGRVKEAQKWNNRDRNNQHRKHPKDYRENYKSDLTSQKESSDPVAIRKQVEFYFSDSNLLQDEFLFNKVQGHDNLPIPISVIHSFKRMRHFQPLSAVVDALQESTTLSVVGDENDHVQRKTPLPEGLKDKPMGEVKKVFEDQAMKRSVYVKGFGEEQPSTQFDVEAFFADFGPTNSVRLRRASNKLFKGSVFVEFDSEDSQKKFLEMDPKPKWKGQDLTIKSKKQYCDDKVEDIKAGRIKGHNSEERRQQGGDDRDWKVRRAEDQRNGHKRGGGGGRGFGSHKGGRGRGGRQGGRRDRDDERKGDRDDRYDSIRSFYLLSKHNALANPSCSNVPKVATTADSGDEVSKATTKSATAPSTNDEAQATADVSATQSPTEPTSKKRAREEDDEPDEGQASKKVATETTDS